MRAQNHAAAVRLLAEIKGVVLLPRRMFGGNVERREIVKVILDMRAFGHRKSEIAENLQPTTSDYANNGRNLQRGHLAPAAAFKFNLGAYQSTFKVTNIAPQDGDMNRDLWGCIEESIAVNWAKKWDLLFVIVGGYATGGETVIGNGSRHITVPRSFFAVVYRSDNKAVLAIEVPNNEVVPLVVV